MDYNTKYLIIGAGPGGLQMGYLLKSLGVDFLILEKSDSPGSFYKKYPTHRKLISTNKKYNYFTEEEFNMRHDWNSLLSHDKSLKLTNYTEDLFPSADIYLSYLNDFSHLIKDKIRYNIEVEKISKLENGEFFINTKNNDQYSCKVLLMATGAIKANHPQDIEGIEHTIDYGDAPTDLSFYKNKRVAILGSGNSAFETADHISGVAAQAHVFIRKKLKFAWETHFVGDLRAVNNNIIDMYQLKSLHAVLNPRIKKIQKLEDGTLQTQHEYDFPESKVPGTLKLNRQYDYILNCTGFKYTNNQLFAPNIQPETVFGGKFYDLEANWMSKNIDNLFFIGTNMQAIDRKSSSGFIHGFRYNIQTLSNLLMEMYEGQSYPSTIHNLNSDTNFIPLLYERFSLSAALFQLFGFLGDLLIYDEPTNTIRWFKELPVNYIKTILPKTQHALVLSLEFGFDKHSNKSSLEFLGPSDPHNTPLSAFLHPVIRHYHQGKEDEFHFGDSLLGRWDMPHSSGGAIASYHIEFINWLSSILNIEKVNVELSQDNPNYEKW